MGEVLTISGAMLATWGIMSTWIGLRRFPLASYLLEAYAVVLGVGLAVGGMLLGGGR